MKKKKRVEFTGNALKDARTKLGISQQELAGEFDIARTTIISAERDTPRPWMAIACLGLGNLRYMDACVKAIDGARFKALREQLGLSHDALGKQLGFAASTILTWERTAPPAWAHPALIGLSVLSVVG